MNSRYRFHSFALLVLLVVTASCRSPGGETSEKNAEPMQQATRPTPMEGEWQVTSASYQLAGPIHYTFRADRLTIESRQAIEKRLDAPQQVAITQWQISIDDSQSPSRLIMKKLAGPGTADATNIEAFELRDGELWMCRDSGDRITADSLRPGSGGWVTGLTRRQ